MLTENYNRLVLVRDKTPEREAFIERTWNALKTYNKTFKGIQDHSSQIVPTLTKRKGKKATDTAKRCKGHTPKQPFKLTSESTYGDLYIEAMQLTNITLEVYEDGKKGISRKIDTDRLELLTKRFKTN